VQDDENRLVLGKGVDGSLLYIKVPSLCCEFIFSTGQMDLKAIDQRSFEFQGGSSCPVVAKKDRKVARSVRGLQNVLNIHCLVLNSSIQIDVWNISTDFCLITVNVAHFLGGKDISAVRVGAIEILALI